jgi:hypothetical protein
MPRRAIRKFPDDETPRVDPSAVRPYSKEEIAEWQDALTNFLDAIAGGALDDHLGAIVHAAVLRHNDIAPAVYTSKPPEHVLGATTGIHVPTATTRPSGVLSVKFGQRWFRHADLVGQLIACPDYQGVVPKGWPSPGEQLRVVTVHDDHLVAVPVSKSDADRTLMMALPFAVVADIFGPVRT